MHELIAYLSPRAYGCDPQDYSCAPQGERTPQEKEIFSLTLENMNFLFLGASVLILLDMSYMSRFW